MSDSTEQASAWLLNFGSTLDRADFDAAAGMFEKDSYWRDLVSFTWNIITGASLSGVADRLVALEEFWAGGAGQLNPPRRSRINPA